MEEHCSSLLRQQWGQTCDRMAGNLGLGDTWSLLGVLLDPTHTKASQRKDISHLLHSSPLTDTDFLAALRDRYICTEPPTPVPPTLTLKRTSPWERFGSVLSPLLFNVTLFPLARALRTIPALSHAFYADDITLWVTTLQAGVDAVATHARSVGLSCSPAKSELLLLLPRGMAPPVAFSTQSPLTAHPFPSSLLSASSDSFFKLTEAHRTAQLLVSPALGLVAHFSLPLNAPLLPLFPRPELPARAVASDICITACA
ncbi:hypothetical protein HPB49_024459 [Dermacentor silvarum]|uniref:Uncharacterized protein n=1 Tax=Dermacentor silvarum TaxID=543639 RepID=A0ACB8D161_DERSI|nr:hypothetical protein HPB49_024459 [Dermacentor silvarum]